MHLPDDARQMHNHYLAKKGIGSLFTSTASVWYGWELRRYLDLSSMLQFTSNHLFLHQVSHFDVMVPALDILAPQAAQPHGAITPKNARKALQGWSLKHRYMYMEQRTRNQSIAS